MHAQERRIVRAEAVRVGVLGPVPARVLVSEAVQTTLVTAVSHRVRALVRAATLLVAPDLVPALRDQPAVEEAIAWAAAALAAEVAAVEAVAVVEEAGGNGRLREKRNQSR